MGLGLAASLSWAGEHEEAVGLAEEVAGAISAAYEDPLSRAVLEADQVLAQCRLEAGDLDLGEWRALRDRRCRTSGLSSPDTAEAFRGLARCWLAAGRLEAALACATTAVTMRDRCVMSHIDSARIDLELAGMTRHLDILEDDAEREYWRELALDAGRRATATLTSALGRSHPLVHVARRDQPGGTDAP